MIALQHTSMDPRTSRIHTTQVIQTIQAASDTRYNDMVPPTIAASPFTVGVVVGAEVVMSPS
jgi:hypothetical protein